MQFADWREKHLWDKSRMRTNNADLAAPTLPLWLLITAKKAFFFPVGYLACELSSGAVTRCRLLSLLKTRALPLAKTPQPKLTSAPRSDEKLW